MKRNFTTNLLLSLLFSSTTLLSQVPAFPGAQGGGAESAGGRGGIIYEVTNLNNDGAGSLRAGIAMSGPRTIVFRVAGTINITSGYTISNPYLTIAGQTAPGGGIQIAAKNSGQNIFNINTHDVTLRYLRLRKGYIAVSQSGNPTAAFAGYNCIYDHLSMYWSTDENACAWGGTSPLYKQTWSWCLMAEPLAAHPTSFITGSDISSRADVMTDIDLHHCMLANSSHRNPLVKNKSFRMVNNIIYNWKFYATQSVGGVNIDIIGNYYKPGPLNKDAQAYEIEIAPGPYTSDCASGTATVYVLGNKGPNNSIPTNDNWTMVRRVSGENGSIVGTLDAKYRRTSPLPVLTYPIIADPVENIESKMLPTIGASQRLDSLGNMISNRDDCDKRVINEYNSNTGILPANEGLVGGFPVIATGTPYRDTDKDGMPDAWEKAKKLNPNDAADRNLKTVMSPYTNLEAFLSGICGVASSTDNMPPSVPAGLQASGITTNSFTLSWTASTDNVGVASYEVFRGTTSCGITAATSLSVTGLAAATTYSMTVKAKDAANNVSAASAALSVKTASVTYTVTFTITDGSKPVPGASVTNNQQTKVSDASGNVVFESVPKGTSQVYTISASGYLTNLVTVNVLDNVTKQVVLAIGSADMNENDVSAKIYPNPAHDVVYIADVSGIVQVKVFNQQGNLVIDENVSGVSVSLDISKLSPGMYIMQVSSLSGTVKRKLVKE